MLGIVLALVSMGGLAYSSSTGESFAKAAFKAYSLLIYAPGSSSVAEPNFPAFVVANILHVVGVLCFSAIIGIVGTEVASSVRSIQHRGVKVLDTRHTVILNWNSRVKDVITQLACAAADGQFRADKPVVVLAEKPKVR